MTVRVDEGDMRSFLEDQAREYGGLEDEVQVEDYEDSKGDEDEPRSKRAGSDEVLQRLEELDPDAAENYRDMQRQLSRNFNSTNELKGQLLELREQMLELRDGAGRQVEEEEKVELPEGVTQENLSMFEQMARAAGFVKKDELAAKEQEQASGSFVQEALRRGAEEFGEHFGTLGDDGKVELNPDIRDKLEQRLERLQDPKAGVTPYDLYLLEFGGGGREGAGARREQPQRQSRASGNRRAATSVRRSTGGGRAPKIYEPKRGDSADDVLDRAWALAKQEI